MRRVLRAKRVILALQILLVALAVLAALVLALLVLLAVLGLLASTCSSGATSPASATSTASTTGTPLGGVVSRWHRWALQYCGARGKADGAAVETPPCPRQQILDLRMFAGGGQGHTPAVRRSLSGAPGAGESDRNATMPVFNGHLDPDEKEIVLRSKNAISDPTYPKVRTSSS